MLRGSRRRNRRNSHGRQIKSRSPACGQLQAPVCLEIRLGNVSLATLRATRPPLPTRPARRRHRDALRDTLAIALFAKKTFAAIDPSAKVALTSELRVTNYATTTSLLLHALKPERAPDEEPANGSDRPLRT